MKNVLFKTAGLLLGAMLMSNSVMAMTFYQPVELGRIGWGHLSPFFGLPISGTTYNDGTTEPRDADVESLSKRGFYKPQKGETTYVKGTAIWGTGYDALYCYYDISQKNDLPLKFGGEQNYVLSTNSQNKTISRINSDSGVTIYTLYHNYCVSHLQILGRQKDGKWVVYLDSKKISDKYFDGKDAYKEKGGIIYEQPTCQGDTIIVKYYRYPDGRSKYEGEFRFKWDDAAQWFGIEQVVY